MANWRGHFKTITAHKLRVMKYCFKVGLYRQGLAHDLSKYTPVEFVAGAKYYDGSRSPIELEKMDLGYSAGWLHHKGRNKHHLEYWIDYDYDQGGGMAGMKMPVNYVVGCSATVWPPARSISGKSTLRPPHGSTTISRRRIT